MNKSTLSGKLFAHIAPTIILTILLIGALAFRSADKQINTVYDAQLISNANVLWTLLSDEMIEATKSGPKKIDDIDLAPTNQSDDAADNYADSRMFRVWQNNKLIMFSDTGLPESAPKQREGFSTVTFKDEKWRIYSLLIPTQSVSIEVGEKLGLRDTLVANILWNLALPLLLLIPVIGLMIWLSIGSGLGTIRTLVEQIRLRTPDDLSHVNTETLPKDLAPLGKSLNHLFSKLERSFTSEKRFTDHAAHQLRTPLATLKLQLQMLSEAATDEERKTLLGELMQSNERASKLVGMLLTSARLNHQSVNLHPMKIYPAIAAVMAELGLLAKEKNIEMSLEGSEDLTVHGDEVLFKLMMNNLVENAIKYTPAGGNVSVTVERQDDSCKISVTDTGQGIPESERALVFERFYRAVSSEEEGSGLGLAIVAEIIERFSGSIALKTPTNGTGLLVEVILPSK